jgi:glucosylceramidase
MGCPSSLKAVGQAAQDGWEMIELDVKLTSDGVPILTHDKTWGREWCGVSPVSYGLAQTTNNPFIEPGTNSKNDSTNLVVSSTSLHDTRSWTGFAELRDSVSLWLGSYTRQEA